MKGPEMPGSRITSVTLIFMAAAFIAGCGQAEQVGIAQAPIAAQRHGEQAQRGHERGNQAEKERSLQGLKHVPEFVWRFATLSYLICGNVIVSQTVPAR